MDDLVDETAVDLCFLSCHGLYAGDVCQFLLSFKKKICGMGLKEPRRIYIGAEFCDRVMSFVNKETLTETVGILSHQGYRITYVTPVVREANWDPNLSYLEAILKEPAVDELAANDFGMLAYMAEKHPTWHGRILAGRLFDKSVREGRFDIMKNPDFRRNSKEMTSSCENTPLVRELFQKYRISRVETDTVPFGNARISCPRNVRLSLYYPRIYLSNSSYCEFSGLGGTGPARFDLSRPCACSCANQYQVISGLNRERIFKIGNAVFTYQTKPLEELADTPFRLVYSLF